MSCTWKSTSFAATVTNGTNYLSIRLPIAAHRRSDSASMASMVHDVVVFDSPGTDKDRIIRHDTSSCG
jgi:hypothetical protein